MYIVRHIRSMYICCDDSGSSPRVQYLPLFRFAIKMYFQISLNDVFYETHRVEDAYYVGIAMLTGVIFNFSLWSKNSVNGTLYSCHPNRTPVVL